jgi:hypothetical protein
MLVLSVMGMKAIISLTILTLLIKRRRGYSVQRGFYDRHLPSTSEGDLGLEPFEHAGPLFCTVFSGHEFSHANLGTFFGAPIIIFSCDRRNMITRGRGKKRTSRLSF